MRFAFAFALVVVVVLFAGGCENPCLTLANRICNCELSAGARQNCRTERVVNQSSNIKTEEADRDFCQQKLDTCTCDALDINDLDACGLVVEGDQ